MHVLDNKAWELRKKQETRGSLFFVKSHASQTKLTTSQEMAHEFDFLKAGITG